MDGVKTDALRPVMLLGASSRPDRIDPVEFRNPEPETWNTKHDTRRPKPETRNPHQALLRPGRLEHHILVPPPDETARLQVHHWVASFTEETNLLGQWLKC